MERRPRQFRSIPVLRIAITALVLFFAAPRPLFAAEDTPAAEPSTAVGSARCPQASGEAKQAGDDAMVAQNYALALECYERAYEYNPTPLLLYNRARALQMLGRNAEALRQLRFFARAASPELKERVPGLDGLMRSLTQRVAELQIDCPVDGASVRVGGTVVGTVPLPDPVPVEPGSVTVEVEAPGYVKLSRNIEATPGVRVVVAFELTPDPPATAAPVAPPAPPAPRAETTPLPPPAPLSDTEPRDSSRESSSELPRWPGWVALGVGTVSTGVAVVSFLQATSAADEVCAGRHTCTESEHDEAAFDRYNMWGDVYATSVVIGVLGLSAGGVWLWQTADSGAEVSVTPSGARVGAYF